MLYYKQITEAYEDRENRRIMKKIGIDSATINRVSTKQLKLIFSLPIITALVHSIFASKIIYQSLLLFGEIKVGEYGKNLTSVLLIFMVMYLVVYFITSFQVRRD